MSNLFQKGTAVIYTTPHRTHNGVFEPSIEIQATYQGPYAYRTLKFNRHIITWRDSQGQIVRRYVSACAIRASQT